MDTEKKKSRGIFGFIVRLILFLWLLIFLSGCLIIMLLVFRPASIWRGFTNIINNEAYIQEQTIDLATAQEAVAGQIENLDEIVISEEVLTSLARETLSEYIAYPTINIEKEKLSIYWSILADDQKNHLVGRVDTFYNNGKFEISDIGVGRISLPGFVKTFIQNNLLRVFDENAEINDQFFLDSLQLDSSRIKINEIRLEKDNMIIDLELNNSIFVR